ncbi:MAG: hypothetical protein JWM80_4506 [Cyanobacteria bacterium RYN_339]|nr:hypothetical protein [Cyanobacteria bacterium RYN_339]
MSYLPPGFPAPDRETMEKLRQSILAGLKTPHPPEWDELGVIISADEAGVDLSGVDAEALWLAPPDERAPIFAALGQLLAEQLN